MGFITLFKNNNNTTDVAIFFFLFFCRKKARSRVMRSIFVSPCTSIKAHLPDGWCFGCHTPSLPAVSPQIWPPFSPYTGPPLSSTTRCDHNLALLLFPYVVANAITNAPVDQWLDSQCDHVLPAPFSPSLSPCLCVCLLSVTAPSARLSPRCGTGYMVIRRHKTCLTRWRTCAPYYGN